MNYSISSSSSPPSPASLHHRSLVDELQKGHLAAEILRRRLIRAPSTSPPVAGNEEPVSDRDLAETIWTSFNISLSIARSCELLLDSRVSEDCKVEDSCGGDGGESASRIKDRRGCYKRKRGQSWTTEGVAPTEDGHQWRKYGQKMILNSEFPRNYYRCTHKMDQGCQAIKQVQKVSDEPPLYKTTYSGNHTCKNPLKPPQIIIPSSSPDQSDSSFLLRFDGSSNAVNPFFTSPHHSMAVKQEQSTATAASQAMMMTTMADYNCLSSSDPATFSGGVAKTGLSTPAGSDHGGDVISAGAYSCSTSSHSLGEMDNYIFLGQDDHLDLIHYECDQF